MSLSKIYRGSEAGELKAFRFRCFGEPELPEGEEQELSAAEFTVPPLASTPVAPEAVEPRQPLAQQLEEAYARGRQEGLNEAEQRFETTTKALAEALEEVCRVRVSLAKSSSQDMLRLVMAVAEQVILRSVEVDPSVILAIIENALQASVRSDSYRIRVNPGDLEVVTKQKPLFLASISGLKNLSFEADASIEKGGCRVDSELGDVDATIETQLESIRQVLSEAITEG